MDGKAAQISRAWRSEDGRRTTGSPGAFSAGACEGSTSRQRKAGSGPCMRKATLRDHRKGRFRRVKRAYLPPWRVVQVPPQAWERPGAA
jgi:hypothetical protein